ncbi:DUF4139 domain-containing protein [Coleofasciculus sp. FACHB-1120]|uniref:DUF4139 domain-containing protein n=1 Tax=Coleofasciculus sp. FACHB-1120 TaxID=2692783 RepID=UPI0016864F48|nr:DUF4139 domain-containing protein [Coleofasciculus sp. FACHB-1120]MBD2744616.1 DUF4139 domain-containing protein [Coleofasciculus sp. FACHB-1120]
MAMQELASRIDTVKVYAGGATVTRIAELPLNAGELPEHVEIPGLPLALDDSSVRVRVDVETQIPSPIASDVRIGLAVPPPQETQNPPPDEELRAAAAEVQRIEDAIALIENEIAILNNLKIPNRPEAEPGKAPPPSPMNARLALANFSDEQIRARIQEKRENLEKLRLAQEYLADLQHKQAIASTARNARPNELRKTIIVRLSYEELTPSTPVLVGEQSQNSPLSLVKKGEEGLGFSRLVIEYFVPGARWTPTYVCRLNSAESSASITVRALICQRTGEDWTGVRLELSTAEPMGWCELPELPSLRLGRVQPAMRKSGWRRPPIGAEILFEDYDEQEQAALAAVSSQSAIANFLNNAPSVPPLPDLMAQERSEMHLSYGMAMAMPAAAPCADYEDVEASLAPQVESRSLGERLATHKALKRSAAAPPAAPESLQRRRRQNLEDTTDENSVTDLLAYGLMRMGAANDPAHRGKLTIEQREEIYLEILQRQKVVVTFNVIQVVQEAFDNAQKCLWMMLPPGGIHVRDVAGSFDYAYSADGRIDVPSDVQFHSVALTSNSTDIDLRYIVVPREDTNVFRIAQLRNPLQAPLLAGPADVYVDGEYILSTNIATVPPKAQMELGLGVEQAIKVSRNTVYEEVRSGETIVSFNELRHKIKIDINNYLPRVAKIEVRERLPIPQEGAKVDIHCDRVSPPWEKYEQQERNSPIKGGYRWQVEVPAKEETTLSVDYIIKTFVDSELIGGNRRES